MMEATFGGGEANVAVSLVNYGMEAQYCTVLPDNAIGDECVKELRRFGVDVSKVQRGPGRMGIYFLENGTNQLPSKVVYDRAYSAIALAKPGDLNWDEVFEGVDWFHITGITPAISESAMELSLESVKVAKEKGITVSCDLNYRKNLWKYGKKAAEVMRRNWPSMLMSLLPTRKMSRRLWRSRRMWMWSLVSWNARSIRRWATRCCRLIPT